MKKIAMKIAKAFSRIGKEGSISTAIYQGKGNSFVQFIFNDISRELNRHNLLSTQKQIDNLYMSYFKQKDSSKDVGELKKLGNDFTISLSKVKDIQEKLEPQVAKDLSHLQAKFISDVTELSEKYDKSLAAEIAKIKV